MDGYTSPEDLLAQWNTQQIPVQDDLTPGSGYIGTGALDTGAGSGLNWAGLQSGLASAQNAAKDLNTSTAKPLAPPTQNLQPGKAGSGAAQLNQLAQLLRGRTQQYFPGSGVNNEPVAIPRSLGLLGF
jgi:hypothetical protein